MTPRWRAVLQVQRLLRSLLTHHVPLGVMQGSVNLQSGLGDVDLVKAEAHALPSYGLIGQVARELAEQLVGEEPFGVPREVPASCDAHPAGEVCPDCAPLIAAVMNEARGPAVDAQQRDGWVKQREQWRVLIEHIRERQQHARDLKTLGSACSEVLVREHDMLLAFIATHVPDPRPPGEPRDLLRIGDELRRRIALRNDDDLAVRDELVDLLAFVGPLMGAPLPDVERFEQYVDGEGFYNLMQAYRHANVVKQGEVTAAFETIKTVLKEQVRK